jgi:hypothetical protein
MEVLQQIQAIAEQPCQCRPNNDCLCQSCKANAYLNYIEEEVAELLVELLNE